MQELDSTNIQEHCFVVALNELQDINKQLEALLIRKDELTRDIIGALEHDHEGQKSYEYGSWKIEVKTPFVYSLDKKKYESGDVNLPDNYNPIKEYISYSVDKRLCDQYMMNAPEDVRDALIELIDKKPGKAGITIKERV